MSHTPTPWKLIDEGIIAAQSPTPVKPGGQPNAALLRTPVIALPPVDYPDYSQFKAGDWEANAAHIVRCVNACEGLIDPERAIRETRELLRDAVQGRPIEPLRVVRCLALVSPADGYARASPADGTVEDST